MALAGNPSRQKEPARFFRVAWLTSRLTSQFSENDADLSHLARCEVDIFT